jgi:hypothetical protein
MATGNLNVARSQARSLFLNNGKVAIAGGFDASGNALASIEIYNPSTGTWSIVGALSVARGAFSLTALPNGQFLAAGGLGPAVTSGAVATADLFDDRTNQTFATSPLIAARGNHGNVLLPSGKVLVAGGTGTNGTVLSSAELYQEPYPTQSRLYLPAVFNQS